MYKAANRQNSKGQASIEAILSMGLIIVPLLIVSFTWANREWKKSEWAFQQYKMARIELIHTRQKVDRNGLVLLPLEDLDHNKEGLGFKDLLNQASALLGMLLP
jgi:hypothetical protein